MTEIRLLDYRIKDYPFHFWLIQIVVFAYVAIRMISRDYSIYGEIPAVYFDYPRLVTNTYPSQVLELFNFHWIHWFVEYPSSKTLQYLQGSCLLMSLIGLLGILPRIMAGLLFVLLTYFTGLIQATNAELEGGTLLLVSLLVLAISSKNCFYSLFFWKNKMDASKENRWPIILLLLFVGAFYTTSGINKIIDVGPWWPFSLHLENLGVFSMEDSLFLTGRRVNFDFLTSLDSYWLSVFSGFVTLIGEIGFISILFFPKYRLFFIVSMAILHINVYFSTGINFLGSIFILFLCFDWNALVRKAIIVYDSDCGVCTKTVILLEKLDVFNRLAFVTNIENSDARFDDSRLNKEMGLAEEDGSILYGADAFEVVFHKVPIFWPIAIFLKIPSMIYFSRFIYKKFAANRYQFGDGLCQIN